ncbi:FAD-dependent oxidoreductase [Brevibacillus sp. GCM10020057]|uniref:flavin monoamine oxidase family protein n=1 Tax=Brevibacillus sp. GCM10020057 TaxID=3317327 RepID=UPI00362E3F15
MGLKVSRRSFIKSGVAFTVTGLLLGDTQLLPASPAKAAAVPTLRKKADVIVIGAGISGLAAAHVLRKRGYETIVLEARYRIGGRIWTERGSDFPAELGASWLHGIDYRNPIPFLTETFDQLQGLSDSPSKGFDQIFRHLAEGLDIRPNQIVHQIHHDDSGVRVASYSDVFQAKYAIVTLPLGVLKSGSITFSPELPDRKLQAINQLGTGLINKLYLKFPYAFWEKDSKIISLPTADGDTQPFLNLYKYTNQPVLLGSFTEATAASMEKWSDEEVAEYAMTGLMQTYGADIPPLTASKMSRWASDPYALGAYTYHTSAASREDILALGESVNNRLFFAGEATHPESCASVHGAYLSGLREAQNIISLT